MSKAEKMFKELGFEKINRYFDILIWVKNDDIIKFRLELKQVQVYMRSIDGKLRPPVSINVELHQAITQQMKELGWLE